MIIESKAPTRVDFAGGTLDIWPLYLFHPGAVTVNAAISLYASCVIETLQVGDSRIKLVSRDINRDAEAIVINVPTGTQDHYPPAFGGAAAIELPPGGEHRVELRVNLDELERRAVVCYTGKPRQHGINNWEVYKAHIGGKLAVQNSLPPM